MSAPRRAARPAARSFDRSAATLAALAALVLAASCAGAPAAAPGAKTAAGTAAPARATRPGAAPSRGAGLEALAPEARTFAAELESRVAAGDWDWILARADEDFLAANPVPPAGRAGSAARGLLVARLFRGAESDSAWRGESARREPLPLDRIRRLRWTEVLPGLPVAVLRGLLVLSDGSELPVELRILWRLEPPRLLGELP